MEIFFSPNGGAAQAIADEMAKAKVSINVLAYTFTNPVICQALLDAVKRGVAVSVIFDETASKDGDCVLPKLKAAGCRCWTDGMHAIAHNKVTIIDGAVVITGSMNYTINGDQHNAENTIMIGDPVIARTYMNNWLLHQSHSVEVL